MQQMSWSHGVVIEKVIERSWNVIEFGFENCVETLVTLRRPIKALNVSHLRAAVLRTKNKLLRFF